MGFHFHKVAPESVTDAGQYPGALTLNRYTASGGTVTRHGVGQWSMFGGSNPWSTVTRNSAAVGPVARTRTGTIVEGPGRQPIVAINVARSTTRDIARISVTSQR